MNDPRKKQKAAYESPAITTCTAQAILEALGPAIAVYRVIT